jgi:amino acid adenylation domain-containing protein
MSDGDLAARRSRLTPAKRELLAHLIRSGSAGAADSIRRRQKQIPAPLSFAQQRLWFLDRLFPGSSAYNIVIPLRLEGRLDTWVLQRVLSELVRRHETLRTTFEESGGEPVQRIHLPTVVPVPLVDLRRLPALARQGEARRLGREEAGRGFDLERGPLLRACLLCLGAEEHVLLTNMHHIVSDGWSAGIMAREVSILYGGFRQGLPSPLPEPGIQYADFAVWQRRRLEGASLEAHLSYWRRHLEGLPPVLELPTDRPRSAARRDRGAAVPVVLGRDLSASLAALGRQENVTPFIVLLALFEVLLNRYSGQELFGVGTPIAGRTQVEVEPLIGFFVNTLVLRADLAGEPTFREMLGRARKETLDSLTHQELPFEKMVEDLGIERSLLHTPLFQVMFTFQNAPEAPLELAGLRLVRLVVDDESSKFDLSLTLGEGRDGFEGGMELSTDLFDRTTVQRLVRHFGALAAAMVSDPRRGIWEQPFLVPEEGQQVLLEWNDTEAVLDPREECVHILFEAQVARAPERIAMVFEGESLSYGELNRRANRLAFRLSGLGVGPEVMVGICLERSLDLVMALLAVLKSGGAYVPLDPEYPEDRLAFMVEDSGLSVLVTRSDLAATLHAGGLRRLDLDVAEPVVPAWSESNPSSLAAPDQLMYVIYTSGSTGRPKGVLVPHRGVVNRLLWAQASYPVTGEDRILHKAAFSFDFSVWECFAPLLAGARLVVARPGGQRDGSYLARVIRQEEITLVHFVPSMLRAFLAEDGVEECVSLRSVFAGGEALPADLEALALKRRVPALRNQYGPTEASIDVTEWICRGSDGPDRPVPLGRPHSNVEIHVLDRWSRPCPLGARGELCIGGRAVTRGYLGRPALTAEKFMPDPFAGAPGGRLYRTGDMARRLQDGRLEFLGRIDHQVKVRGFRIELGEIEAVLAGFPGVLEAVAVVREDVAGDRRLVAYVTGAVPAEALCERLRERLPEHMVPAAVVVLDALPLTPNGKVDRKALPAPEWRRGSEGFVAPRTPVEQVLAGIWSELLGVERVGAYDSFFALGGHSLLATRVTSRLPAAFGVELPLRDLFEAPTLAGLAARVEAALRAGAGLAAPPLVPVPRGGRLPLSFAQQRLWFIDQLEPDSPLYNMPLALRVEGPLAAAHLVWSLTEVVRRHEALRTVFAAVEGMPEQVVLPPAPFALPVVDLSALRRAARDAQALALTGEEAGRAFDLTQGPLLRGALLRLDADDHVALLTLHHIAGDGWSLGLLVKEVSALYAAAAASRPSPLPELPVQYADFAAWQRSWLTGEVLEQEVSYWSRRLAGLPPLLELPTDRPRPAVQTFRGASRPLALPAELTQQIRTFSQGAGATPFMVLLAGFQVLLARYGSQRDFAVGAPIAGRNRAEVEELIGFFVNTLVLRANLAGDRGFRELLGQVRETSLAAHLHQDVPFEKLVEELAPERSLAYAPLFQVMLVLQNTPAESLDLQGLHMRRMEADGAVARFDLTLALEERDGRLLGGIEYATDLFDGATIDRFASHFERLLAAAVATPETSILSLPLLGGAERWQILVEWNATGEPAAPACLHDLVEAQAWRTPGAVAVIAGDEEIRYAALLQAADRLAASLRRQGVGSEVVVGVCLERTADLVIALLAILKAGGAYLPLDPKHPRARLAGALASARVAVVVSDERLAAGLPWHGPVVLAQTAGQALPAGDRAAGGARPENLAYVLYTSGSTGTPKGVAVTHRSAVEMVRWAGGVYGPEELAGVLASTSLSFDLSVFELFVPLAWGGTVILAENALELPHLPAADRVRLVNTVPSAMAELVRAGSLPASVRTVNLAGEPLPRALADRLYATGTVERVWNLYGPSEDTTYSIFSRVPNVGAAAPAIGRPVAATRAYVLDAEGVPVPVGTTGELYLGGVGLARGYLHGADLTAERFVPDPFGAAGARLYRTGDVVRWTAAGELDFIGRADFQVKVRGFRIELGEIEAVLAGFPGVLEAVAVVREDVAGDRRLVAYVTGAVPAEALRERLIQRLPEHMVPAAVVVLDALPLTPSGKVDRKALPAPEWRRGSEGFVAPRTPVEQVLAGIWSELLGIERVGEYDSFFALGGHSLLATRVTSRLPAAFGVELPLRDLFEAPTLAGLAARVEAALRAGAGLAAPPLVPVPRGGRLPLSFAQQRLWFIDQLEPDSPLYNMPLALRVEGPLAAAHLVWSLTEVVRRHEALRTVFAAVEGMPEQVVLPPAPFALPVVDLSALRRAARDAQALALTGEEAGRAFDLTQGPLLRGALLRLDADDHVALLTLHHIAGDGWSLGLLVKEVSALYAAAAASRPSPLPELPVQYADFAAWQRSWLTGEVLEQEVSYWSRRLAGLPPLLELPTDRPRPAVQTFRGASRPLALPAELTQQIRTFSQGAGATPFMVLLAGFQVLLARYGSQRDFAVGAPIAGRNRAEVEELIGFFVNTLVLRANLAGDRGFRELLGQVRETSLAAHLHQDVPFEKLVEELAPERSLAYAPLFQVMLVLQNTPAESLDLQGLHMRRMEADGAVARFDLTLALEERDGRLLGGIEYATDLFDGATIDRFASHFERLLAAAVATPETSILSLPLLGGAERQELLRQGRGPVAERPSRAFLHEMIAAQALRTPDRTALVAGGERLTYRELMARSGSLARELSARGVGPDVVVALFLERSVELVVALLAVLGAGGAYLPLDLSHPGERLSFLLGDARAGLLLTAERLLPDLPETAARVLFLETLSGSGAAEAPEAAALEPDNLAYVLYTSGSTGRPKGVAVTHRGLANYLLWAADAYPVGEGAPVHSPMGFDLTVTSLYLPLIAGRSVTLLPEEQGGQGLAAALAGGGFGLLKVTPAHLEVLGRLVPPAQAAECGSVFVIGGEPLSAEQLAFWRTHAPDTRLINEYGPTETVVGCTFHEVTAEDGATGAVPIGRPIANVEIQLLDPELHLVPVGVPGELYIGGAGVCRGYLNRLDQTAERFVPDPSGSEPGARLYRTGDLVRWTAAGNLELLRRLDDQVKVRGFRIELGEIEAALSRHPGVRGAAVLVREDIPGDRRLVAYVAGAVPSADLRQHLRGQLPEYMVPSVLELLDELPLTANGKIDRRALPAPGRSAPPGLVAPRTPVEEILVEIWREVLGVESVGVEDNFFERGGHSLLAVSLMFQIEKRFGRSLPLAALFEHPTLAALADLLSQERWLRPRSHLAMLQPSGDREPFFCVHPVGGNVLCYVDLARRLGPEQPVHALQSLDPAPGGERPASIEEMAAVYLRELTRVQPRGPYRLGGWSMGGLVAFEMARQLKREGQPVELVALIDTPPPAAEPGRAPDEVELVAELAGDIARMLGRQVEIARQELEPLTLTGKLEHVAVIARAAGLVPRDFGLAQILPLFETFAANLRASRSYVAGPYSGSVTAWFSEETRALLPPERLDGWSRLTLGGVETAILPGGHYDLLRHPMVEVLACQLASRLL